MIEIHAYKIGNSEPAPQFKIIEQPNDFAKTVKRIAQDKGMNESQSYRLEFWTQFNDILEQRGRPFNKRKATTDPWYSIAIGSSECQISIDLVNKEHKIRVGLWIANNKKLFDNVYAHKDEIESTLGFELSWQRMNHRKSSRICKYIEGLDFTIQDNYAELMNESIDLVVRMRDALSKYIQAEP